MEKRQTEFGLAIRSSPINDGAPRDIADVIARLRALADEDGVVTSAQIDEVLGPLNFDIEFLLSEIEHSGLDWKDQHLGPPVIPPDYPGLRLVKGKPA